MNAAKAYVAAIVAGLSTFVATVQGRTDVNTMRPIDWIIVVLASVIAALTVYITPNKPKETELS